MYYDTKACFFKNFVDSNNLFDLVFSSPSFTWCNNQTGSARYWARLYHCLVNMEWSNTARNYNLQHLIIKLIN